MRGPFANPEKINDTARAWDAEVLYDRYHVDTTILNNRDDILQFANDLDLQLPVFKAIALQEATTLLDERYAELVVGETEKSNSTRDKLNRLEQEWKKRYLYPRIERAGIDKYDDWVETHARAVGLDSDSITDWGDARHLPYFWMALSSVELVPLWGLRLIEPPNVEVTGNHGNATIYRWSEVDATYEGSIDIFPSTRKRLREAEIFDLETKTLDLDEQEVALRGLSQA